MENNWIETDKQLPSEPGKYICVLYGDLNNPLEMTFTLTPKPKFIHHFKVKEGKYYWYVPHISIYQCQLKGTRKCKVSHWKRIV